MKNLYDAATRAGDKSKAAMRTTNCPTESIEQQNIISWARLREGKYPALKLLYHIPNEGKRSLSGGRRLVAEGLKSGVPDMCLPVARGEFHALYIELKRVRGGRVSDAQSAWLKELNRAGNLAVVCNGWEEAAKVMEEYLSKQDAGGAK